MKRARINIEWLIIGTLTASCAFVYTPKIRSYFAAQQELKAQAAEPILQRSPKPQTSPAALEKTKSVTERSQTDIDALNRETDELYAQEKLKQQRCQITTASGRVITCNDPIKNP